MFAVYSEAPGRKFVFDSFAVHCVSGQSVIKFSYKDFPFSQRELHLTQQEASKLANLLKEAIAGNTLVGTVI